MESHRVASRERPLQYCGIAYTQQYFVVDGDHESLPSIVEAPWRPPTRQRSVPNEPTRRNGSGVDLIPGPPPPFSQTCYAVTGLVPSRRPSGCAPGFSLQQQSKTRLAPKPPAFPSLPKPVWTDTKIAVLGRQLARSDFEPASPPLSELRSDPTMRSAPDRTNGRGSFSHPPYLMYHSSLSLPPAAPAGVCSLQVLQDRCVAPHCETTRAGSTARQKGWWLGA